MKAIHISTIAGLILMLPAAARTWTDTTGRKIEADMVRVDGDKVVLKLKGREVPLALTRLCAEDQKFVADWKPAEGDAKPADAKPAAAAGDLIVCGTPIKPGGGVTVAEEPLSAAALKSFNKATAKPAKLKIGVALPASFDPAKPQRVMWVSAAINSEEERKKGNIGAMGSYVQTATAAGWVVIAADTDLGNPRMEDNQRATGGDLAVHKNAVEALTKALPAFKTWEFACCGFSGGAKAAFYRVGDLLACDLKVIGMFLGGCNQDMTADAREETKCSKGDLRKVNVFISNGKGDNISSVTAAEGVAKSTKSNFGKINLELFDGGHSLDQDQFNKALAWFVAPVEKEKEKSKSKSHR